MELMPLLPRAGRGRIYLRLNLAIVEIACAQGDIRKKK